MVAGGDEIDPGGEELGCKGRGQPVAAGGVFGIDDERIERKPPLEFGYPRQEGMTPGAADEIAHEENPHPSLPFGPIRSPGAHH